MYTCDHCGKEIDAGQAGGMNPVTGEPLCGDCANLSHYEFLFMRGAGDLDLWIAVDRQQNGAWLPFWLFKSTDQSQCSESQVMLSCSALTWWDAIEGAQIAIRERPEAWGLSIGE